MITLQINETNKKLKRQGVSFSELKVKATPIIKNLNKICNQIKKALAALNPKINIGNDRSATYFIQWKMPSFCKPFQNRKYLSYSKKN